MVGYFQTAYSKGPTNPGNPKKNKTNNAICVCGSSKKRMQSKKNQKKKKRPRKWKIAKTIGKKGGGLGSRVSSGR